MTTRRATVVGGGLNALGVVRSLAADGIGVDLLVGEGEAGPAVHTRLARVRRYADTTRDGVVNALIHQARRHRRPARPLVLTREEDVAAVSCARRRLADDYVLMLPPADVVTRLQDKTGFAEAVAAQNEIAPRSLAIRTPADIDGIGALAPPFILKPAGRQPAYLAHYPRAERFEDAATLAAALAERLSVSPAMIVQEWVDGPDEGVHFCLQFVPPDGAAALSFVGHKLRSWPRATGGTARCTRASSAADGLAARTTAFFRGAGVVGLASMEYKWHASCADYVMIEPTIGRTDHQEEIATLCGVNLPAAACRWALGEALPHPAAGERSSVIWRDPMADAKAADVDPAGAGAFDMPIVDALWRLRDPGPQLADWRQRAVRRLRRGLSR
ncbi:FAD-dependent oxidoreductase [Salinisphaera sp. Q1T1-3]|uniref:FAD-dependent oxidoreductase n=1 Tax=Salinisphaera sp. Q1T1-3 TaxID=2321229 RepID=UPI0011C47FAF|nr:FAD-dependent oxidoreductase [Salinisphaera sp. Q1T1-3]